MNVSIAGTGTMARAIATRVLAGGHEVVFIGTHIAKAEDLADELTGLGTVRAAEEVDSDILVLAVPYSAAPHVVRQHAAELDGTVVIDISNPVDDSFEPMEVELGSGAQVIAAAAPDGAPVVKAFNTTFAGTLMAGEVAGQPLDVFIAGDDEAAKAKVARLVQDGGLRPIDAGPLRRARELEALGYLHMAIQHTRDTLFATAVKVLP
ncbi:MAG: reduced coenzyme oxidoreductase [Solirubrobacterales bacterium]|jgi:predicted dinucleotide-binding enzyme|nr:reduced coenzyme oxidoreductase [Solirubrobacterales bacterium]